MLELWKPILTLKDKNNPVIFTDLCYTYSEWDSKLNKSVLSKDHHPFIIFYDNEEDCYYYLKARGALKPDGVSFKKKFKHEIKVRSSEDGGMFYKDSYVDCSQIFKCDRELLESLVDVDHYKYKETLIIRNYQKQNILDEILQCIFEVPPYLSIVEVKLDENNFTYGESLYLCDEKIDKYFDVDHDLKPDIEEYLFELNSSKDNEFKQNRNRYQTGINFCLMFLNEYFPDQIEEFKNIQELDPPKQSNSQKR